MSAAQSRIRLYTVAQYLTMERASEEKHQYLDGHILAMAGESKAHGRISVNVIIELGNQLKGTNCELFAKDTKVRTGADPDPIWPPKGMFSYPDILVLCGAGEYHDHYQDVLLNPRVIIEVLSAGTAEFDSSEKFRRYREYLPSLTDYILVSQLEPALDHYRKQPNGDWLLSSVTGLNASLRIDSIGCTLALSDVYARVDFNQSPTESPTESSTESSAESSTTPSAATD